jgi:ADP-ribose pyrophosphatase YjhB (NUDIX family)
MSKGQNVMLVNRTFVVHKGNILAVQRSRRSEHNPSLWEIPGGKREGRHGLQESLEQEVIEETGLLIRPVDRIFHVEDNVLDGEGRYGGMTRIAFFRVSTVIGGELKLSDEHDAHRWCTYAKLLKLELRPDVRKAAISLARHLRQHGAK